MIEVKSGPLARPIDRVIRPLVDNLNRLPGLKTMSSCQGHADERRPYVHFVCREEELRLILAAITVLNSEEPRNLRAYVEILDYGDDKLDVVLRFHHLFLRVKPTRATVREWHRRVRAMNELVVGEIESGLLRSMDVRPAFRERRLVNVTMEGDAKSVRRC